jgi:hypothetical protein
VETLYGAIDDGAIAIRLPQHAKKELEAYLDCGLLCRGFARLRCESCDESRREDADGGLTIGKAFGPPIRTWRF